MSSTNTGDQTAAEIEREVEQTRARLTGTVESLKDRVSPGQVAEQAMDWLRGSGGKEFATNLGGTLRDNPVPVLLIAAGIGWLALGGRGEARASRPYRDDYRDDRYAPTMGEGYAGGSYAGAYPGESYDADTYSGQRMTGGSEGPSMTQRAGEAASGLRDRAQGIVGQAGEAASGAWESATDTARSLADRASGTARSLADSASGTARSVAESASGAGRNVADRAGQAWQSASGTASDLGNRAYRVGDQAGRRVMDLAESQPLLIGAFGLAVGAALGALMPSSEAEDRLMGETRDNVAGRISSLAGEAYDRAKELAGEQVERAGEHLGEAYDRTRERVAGTGLSPTEGASALGAVARDVREAVERTVQGVAGAARDAAGKPEGRPEGSGPA